jgi:hypothetical protein
MYVLEVKWFLPSVQILLTSGTLESASTRRGSLSRKYRSAAPNTGSHKPWCASCKCIWYSQRQCNSLMSRGWQVARNSTPSLSLTLRSYITVENIVEIDNQSEEISCCRIKLCLPACGWSTTNSTCAKKDRVQQNSVDTDRRYFFLLQRYQSSCLAVTILFFLLAAA